MATWIYLASISQATRDFTVRLARDEGLVVCPYFSRKENVWQAKNHVVALAPADEFYLLYAANKKVEAFNTFKLQEANSPLSAVGRKHGVPEGRELSNVFSVINDDSLIEQLNENGYSGRRDPKMNIFTAISVKEVETEEDLLYFQRVYDGLKVYKQPLHKLESK